MTTNGRPCPFFCPERTSLWVARWSWSKVVYLSRKKSTGSQKGPDDSHRDACYSLGSGSQKKKKPRQRGTNLKEIRGQTHTAYLCYPATHFQKGFCSSNHYIISKHVSILEHSAANRSIKTILLLSHTSDEIYTLKSLQTCQSPSKCFALLAFSYY